VIFHIRLIFLKIIVRYTAPCLTAVTFLEFGVLAMHITNATPKNGCRDYSGRGWLTRKEVQTMELWRSTNKFHTDDGNRNTPKLASWEKATENGPGGEPLHIPFANIKEDRRS
jgi:hypothetical protein